MKAGRELDLLVAEKVMGFDCFQKEVSNYSGGPPNIIDVIENDYGEQDRLKPYSTDIAAAWEIVEKFKDHLDYPVSVGWNYGAKRWQCTITSRYAFADTASHVICLAALKAKGVEIETE